MINSYTESLTLRTCHCDMFGEWRPSGILEAMQEAAVEHSNRLGVGRADTLKAGMVWVLSRAAVEMERLPGVGETVSVETFTAPRRHMFFPRGTVIRDAEGREIGWGSSLWLLMDLATRRAGTHPDIAARMPENGDAALRLGLPATVRPLEGEAVRGQIEPQYSDLDVNGHVNNAKYLDWCCNALGVAALAESRLLRFDVNYEAEVRPGGAVETELARREGRFTFCGATEGRRRFAVAGELTARA